EEPTAQQLLGDITSEHCPQMSSFPSGLPGLNPPFPSTGYFPYHRTEGELCTDPAGEPDRFFTETEDLENEEGGQGKEIGFWGLYSSCLI
ncbi:hypothetical protein N300_08555, partial [Calypte anna]